MLSAEGRAIARYFGCALSFSSCKIKGETEYQNRHNVLLKYFKRVGAVPPLFFSQDAQDFYFGNSLNHSKEQ